MWSTYQCSLAAVLAIPALVNASVLTPPVLPLVVRNPYLSTWLANAREAPWTKWPIFWAGQEVGMSIMASIPHSHTVYPLLGRPQDSLSKNDGYEISYPTYIGAQFDASTTNLSYQISAPNDTDHKPLDLTISFFSPITPTSTLRQSIPASYINIIVDGNFDVDIYMDVNGLWVSGDPDANITWSKPNVAVKDGPQLQSWQIQREEELLYTENDDRAEWGRLLFTGPADARHESGSSHILRTGFAKTGTLRNKTDTKFRTAMDDEPVFAFQQSLKLGNKDTKDASIRNHDCVLFTLTHIQDDVVQFASARGLTDMRPLWKSYFTSDAALISYHYQDLMNATMLAKTYSDQLNVDAVKADSVEYRDILALSARQVLGAVQFSGTPENPLIFQKEISSNGNTQTVDVIFPAFPFYLYTQPKWAAYLLEPLLEHQLSGQYPNKYSMHDLGAHFPNLTGHADGKDEYMPVEECGDMLIMGLALVNGLLYGDGKQSEKLELVVNQQKSILQEKDKVFALDLHTSASGVHGIDDESILAAAPGLELAKRYLKPYFRLYKQWTEYLIEFSLEPHNQLCTDDFAGWLALQTNLALKGIIGIKAMSALSEVMGHDDEVSYYKNISHTYASKWQTLGMSRDGSHAKLAYDWYGSWTTLYSLYPSTLLCFQSEPLPRMPSPSLPPDTTFAPFLPPHLYTNQSQHYARVMQTYGLPLDSRHRYTKSDWAFSAAAVASPAVRSQIYRATAKWLNETEIDAPFSDLYETEGRGGWPEGGGLYFKARPVVGGHFAQLAMERACGARGGR